MMSKPKVPRAKKAFRSDTSDRVVRFSGQLVTNRSQYYCLHLRRLDTLINANLGPGTASLALAAFCRGPDDSGTLIKIDPGAF